MEKDKKKSCLICESNDELKPFNNQFICESCISYAKTLIENNELNEEWKTLLSVFFVDDAISYRYIFSFNVYFL